MAVINRSTIRLAARDRAYPFVDAGHVTVFHTTEDASIIHLPRSATPDQVRALADLINDICEVDRATADAAGTANGLVGGGA